MKKVLTLVIALMLSLGMLAGCSTGSDDDVLTVWIPVYQFGDGISDEDFWNEKFDAFEEEYGVTVNVEILSWTDYATQIYTGLLSNEGPDVVYVTEPYDLIEAGLLAPLDEYLTDEDYELYLYLEQGYYDSDGNLMTFPMMAGNPCVVFYNMDLLEGAGITELPTTWEEFMEVCITLKEVYPDIYPFVSSWGASNGISAMLAGFWPFFFQAGGTVLDEDGNFNLDSDAALQALEFINSFIENGIWDESIVSMDDPNEKFVNGEAAIIINGPGNSTSYTSSGVNWQAQFALEGPAGIATNFSIDYLAISTYCEQKDVAAALIKYMTSAEVMDEFHTEIYGMLNLTTDATYSESEPFQSMYDQYSDKMYVIPSFEGSSSVADVFQQNVQGMLMGELTPAEVISETMAYYYDQILE